MIVIPAGNQFVERERSGRVREIGDILRDVLAGYDAATASTNPSTPAVESAPQGKIISPPIAALPIVSSIGATSH